MINAPHLWLPDRLRQRREDERLMAPGRTRRWMPGYPCCCGKLYCNCGRNNLCWGPFSGYPSGDTDECPSSSSWEFELDLDVGGWTNRICSDCSIVSGTFVLSHGVVGGPGDFEPRCIWGYFDGDVCPVAWQKPGCLNIYQYIDALQSATQWRWVVGVVLGSNQSCYSFTGDAAVAIYATDLVDDGKSCMAPGVDGVLTLYKIQERTGDTRSCRGSLPAEITSTLIVTP